MESYSLVPPFPFLHLSLYFALKWCIHICTTHDKAASRSVGALPSSIRVFCWEYVLFFPFASIDSSSPPPTSVPPNPPPASAPPPSPPADFTQSIYAYFSSHFISIDIHSSPTQSKQIQPSVENLNHTPRIVSYRSMSYIVILSRGLSLPPRPSSLPHLS